MAGFDWNDLRFFLEVARAGTLSGAARTLGTDHATVGRRVSALERDLQTTLFRHSPTGYVITREGEALLGPAEQMEVLALRSAQGGQDATALSGMVRLSAPDGLGNFFLAGQLQDFVAAHPRLRLQLVTVQQVQAQSQREGDVVITLAPPAKGRFASERLTAYGLGLYASADYLDAHAAIASRQDVRQHRLVGYVDDLIFARELDYLGEIVPAMRAQVQSSSLLAQVAATQAGAGICVLPHYVARQFADLVPVLPGAVALQREYWLNAPIETAKIPRIRAVLDFVRRAVAKGAFT